MKYATLEACAGFRRATVKTVRQALADLICRIRARLSAAWSVAVILGLAFTAFASLAVGADQRAFLTLWVNQAKKAEVFAVLRRDDVLLPVADLEAAGLKGFGGRRETIGGKLFVSLSSLAPQIKYELDVKTVAIKLTAETSYLGLTTVDVRGVQRPANLVHARNPSLFFNYSVDLANLSQVNTFGEIGLSLFGNSVLSSTVSRSTNGAFNRGVTSLTIDDPQDVRRLEFGDTFVGSQDPLGGGASVGGVVLSRNFSLDPYLLNGPVGSFTGRLTTPSTVEVYSNDRLALRETLPPGTFSLQNIPYFGRTGTTRVVIRDAFGREQEFSSPFYLGPFALRQGTSDYRVGFGLLSGLGSYHQLAFAGTGRYGLSNSFTPGLRLEGNPGLLSGGPQFTFGTPLGSLVLSAGVSEARASGSANALGGGGGSGPTGARGKAAYGYAASMTFSPTERLANRFGWGAAMQFMSPHYANLSLGPAAERATFLLSLSGSLSLLEGLSLSPEFQYSRFRDSGPRTSYGASAQFRLTKHSFVFVNATVNQSRRVPPTLQLFGGLSVLLGNSTVSTHTYGRQLGGLAQGSGTYGSQLAKSPPQGPGLGYVINTQTGMGMQSARVQLIDHGTHGSYEFNGDRQGKQNSYQFSFRGSLVALGGRLFAGPPVEGSYALIRTPGVANVEGYLHNQVVGRTDSRGDLLVPRLIPYYANQITINDHDFPVNYRIDSTKEIVAPPLRGGAVVTFPARPVRSVLGKLQVQIEGRAVTPSFGTLTMTTEGKDFTSPIGRDGAFFLDSPPAGRYPARIDFETGKCTFMIDIPGSKDPFVRLGMLRCTM